MACYVFSPLDSAVTELWLEMFFGVFSVLFELLR